MSDDVTQETTETVEAQAAETPEPAGASERVEDLPEFAQKMIAKLRDEAKSHRLKAKEAATSAESAVDAAKAEILETAAAERDAIAAERDSVRSELTRLRVALNAGVSPSVVDEFAGRLKGDTEDELKADAERLSEIFNVSGKPERKADPSQGQHLPLNGDPILNKLNAVLGL